MLFARIVLFVVGSFLLVLSLFVYEDEERRIQSRVEELWIKLDESRIKSLATEKLLITRLYSLANRILDGIFGPDPFSIRLVVASVAVSILTLAIIEVADVTLFGYIGTRKIIGSKLLFLMKDVGPDFLILPGAVFLVKRHRVPALITTVLYVVYSSLYQGTINLDARVHPTMYTVGIFAGSLCSISTDVLCLWLLRKILRWSSALTSASTIILTSLGSLLLTVVVWLWPVFLSLSVPTSGRGLGEWTGSASYEAFIVSAVTMNIFDFLFFCLVVLFIAVLVLHHLLWPSLQRPLYVLQRTGVLASRKAILPIAVAMIGTGISLNRTWISPVIDAIMKALGG